MTPPPAVAERATRTASAWGALRKHLSDREWDRFNLQVFEARHASPEEFQHLLEAWLITVAMREDPNSKAQYERFIEQLRMDDGQDAIAL